MANVKVNWLSLAAAAGLSLALAAPAMGGGIEVPMQDAKAAGMADAFTAQADDPSAIFYNPAGLTQLHGTNLSGGLYYLQPEYQFDGDNGTNQSQNLPSLLPHVFAESDLGTDRLHIGLGIANTFGINEDYGNTGPLRFLADNAQLMVLNIAPTVAYKFNEHFSAGVAFNIYYGDMLLTRNVPLGAPPTPEGSFHFRGDDVAFGVTPGFMYKVNEHHTIGAYYRSPFQLNFDGKAEVKTPGPTIGPSSTSAELRFPQSFGLGYAWRPNNHWTVEGDAIWTDWHAVKQLALSSSNPAFNGQTLPANWKSGWTFRLGTQYAFDEHWAVRAGYAYGQNAVPTETFGPLVPDSNYHLFALGFGYSAKHWGVDVAGNYIYRETHHVSGSVNSPTVDGEWSNAMYGLMATFTVKL